MSRPLRPAGYERPEALLELSLLEPQSVGAPCENCQTWTRAGIIRLGVVDDELRAAIQHKAPAAEVRRLAAAGGMRTLVQDGLDKCALGVTDVSSVLAVCSR